MKLSFFVILFCISVYSSAQNQWSKEGKGFNSFFKDKVKGSYSGSVRGILEFETPNGDNFLQSFSEDLVYLNIIEDPENIYDVSYKSYTINNKNLQFEYSTYAFANSLSITKEGVNYQLNLIDGACIYVIKWLDYKYITDVENELLIIHFTGNVGLFVDRNYTKPQLFIQKGSTLIFSIKKN